MVNQRGNLTLNKESVIVLFHAPLGLYSKITSSCISKTHLPSASEMSPVIRWYSLVTVLITFTYWCSTSMRQSTNRRSFRHKVASRNTLCRSNTRLCLEQCQTTEDWMTLFWKILKYVIIIIIALLIILLILLVFILLFPTVLTVCLWVYV